MSGGIETREVLLLLLLLNQQTQNRKISWVFFEYLKMAYFDLFKNSQFYNLTDRVNRR